jgi:hypothetical protein
MSGGSSQGSNGIGIALPLLLVATLVAAVAFLLGRKRGTGEPGSA